MSATTIILAGRYRYEDETDEIGRGGFARVVKARDLTLDRDVAVKLLEPNIVQKEPAFAQRFSVTAREASRLSHVNIVTLHDFGVEGSQLYLVMEYLPGGDLAHRLKAHGPFVLEEALAILEPISAALDYAHKRGLVHRDVKPQNILFAEDGRPVLTDFELAKLLASSETASSVVMSSGAGALGTAEYMAPEQALGRPVSPATDVYALAVTLFQLLTGAVPFKGDSWMSTLFQATNMPRGTLNERLPQGLSQEARAALLAGMAIKVEERPQSGAVFIAGLRAASRQPEPSPATSPRPAPDRRALPPGLPQIEWGEEVPPGEYQISFEKPVRITSPYRLGKYPVTNAQFDLFVNAADVDDPRWWQGMPEDEKYRKNIKSPRWSGPSRPRECVTWYQDIAFCRWLDHHLKAAGVIGAEEEIDLPHEFEWEVAARYAGNGRCDKRKYPWGDEITPRHANYNETGLKQTSDVGSFPLGMQPELGLYDMSGNVWEWCRNKYDKPDDTAVDSSEARRTLRGGSWDDTAAWARAASRGGIDPLFRNGYYGFRVAARRPPSQHDL